ncbi:Phosphorus acquisition-controlling protein [Ceratocystis platani]|uniref:Phosphorus acquisition-controlling protein n=1 Tax=Ceratocystis fimbriata f. sp. platani TaxID=88771 RepID=A0A0F8BRK8_CERFI|nr:Phosphorus acquisition-controlling protein [Ceratocystis platani]
MASYFSPHQVPPTPQSLELAAGNGNHYYCSTDIQPSVFDSRFSQLKDQPQDSDFTPLVSPAVTPLESQFSVDVAFSVAANYFSPLTSPALHAQNDSSIFTDIRHLGTSSNSPVDRADDWNAPEPSSKKLRKVSTKAPTKAPRPKTNVRQSPIVKPQRRRINVTSAAATNPSIAAQVLDEAEEGTNAKLVRSQIEEPEENASVSPEALSDMPPPPLPPLPRAKSGSASPFIQPQNPKSDPTRSLSNGRPAPATPASLMKLPASKASRTPTMVPESITSNGPVDAFRLPDPASFHNNASASDVDTHMHNNNVIDNTARQPAVSQPSSPMFTKPQSTAITSQSPQMLPANPGTTPNPRKTPLLAVRGSKRPNSVQASPALLPKISPHIKPLLPNGAEDAASRLLTTKSNYQNILEGNNVPGVTYPSELSTNLTSKRTSHKIAEQGRRNRINSALQEIATLLPAPPPKEDSGDGDPKDAGKLPAATPSSKASTVELAIEYIKQLKEEVAAANRRAAEAERRLRESGIENGDSDVMEKTD